MKTAKKAYLQEDGMVRIDGSILKALKMYAVENDTNIRAVVSDLVRKYIIH